MGRREWSSSGMAGRCMCKATSYDEMLGMKWEGGRD